MKIPIIDLSLDNVLKLKQENDWNDHFKLILWPRILTWLGLKEQFNSLESLDWKIHYTPENMHNNFISMHIKDEKDTFNFYFQVPLVQNLSFNLYLGDNTYNFFETYPLIIKNNLISEDEYKVKATSTILPHLLLSSANHKYSRDCLMKINDKNYLELTKQIRL